ncbi:MAG TPA: ATP-binding protein [Bryobacteraceae bacterium]|nr:ATP-binding protein [Bryobacteraceae bacterium]
MRNSEISGALNPGAASMGANRLADLKQANSQLEQAIYALVHDLREPLRQIGTQTEFLRRRFRTLTEEEAGTMFRSVMESVEYMRGMIDATLELGEKRYDAAAIVVTVNTRAIMDGVLRSLPVDEMRAAIRTGYLPPVAAKREHVQQIFLNLLGNAIKYRSERPLEIVVEASPDRDFWVFAVRDNGIGIESDDYSRIFEMFRRGRNNAIRDGNGLGLATCKSIVERYNGRIWVKSTPGEGSTFYFTLPAVPAGSLDGNFVQSERAIRSSAISGEAAR